MTAWLLGTNQEREKETANGPLGYFVCLTMNPLPFADINKHQTAKVDE